MPPGIRILAHAGSSTSRQQDEKHRAQARAYLHWNSTQASRVELPEHKSVDGQSPQDKKRQLSLQTHEATNKRRRRISPTPHDDDLIQDTQLAVRALESQFFTSVVPSSARTTRRIGVLEVPVLKRTRGSSVTKTSTGSKSFGAWPIVAVPRGRTQILERSLSDDSSDDSEAEVGNDRVVQASFESTEKSGPPSNPSLVREADEIPVPAVSRSRQHRLDHALSQDAFSSQSNGSVRVPESFDNEPTSQLPSTFSLTDSQDASAVFTSPQRPPEQPRSQNDIYEGTDESQGLSSVEGLSAQRNSGRPVSKAASSPIRTKQQPKVPPGRSISATAHFPSRANYAIANFDDLPTTIRPPAPETSVASFVSHVTEALRHLVDDEPLSKSYSPVSTARSIDPLERGHWLVSCHDWSAELKRGFWRMLQTTIGSGLAGWSVWCQRGAEKDWEERDSQRLASSTVFTGAEDDFGPVKVYCWGEVVMHIYLLLYVASNSRVRRHGLQWIDAEGKVVVQMRTAAAVSDQSMV